MENNSCEDTKENSRQTKDSYQKLAALYAKTIYFNSLWKDFLSKASFFICIMSGYLMYKSLIYSTLQSTYLIVLFDLVSICISIASSCFLQRIIYPLHMFKFSFAMSLFQCAWWTKHNYDRSIMKINSNDLNQDSIPFGMMYFMVTWVSDRYMMRSEIQCKQAIEEFEKTLKQD